MSEVMNNIKTRRAVRKYKEDMVPKEIIQQIVEAGTYAPTGRNMQSPIIIAVTNKEMRDRMSELNAKVAETSSDPFYGAPVVLVVLADKSKPCYQYDGTLVMALHKDTVISGKNMRIPRFVKMDSQFDKLKKIGYYYF